MNQDDSANEESEHKDGMENSYSQTDSNPLTDPEERKVIYAVLDSFYQYRKNLHYNTTHRRRQNFYALPSAQWQMLAAPPFSILDTFNAVDDAIDCNADLADAILNIGFKSFSLPENPEKDSPLNWHNKAKPNDMSKVHSTIRQFYRDWSEEGYNLEIKPLLDIILTDLKSKTDIPTPSSKISPRILLPGAGLGRLLFELSMRGYNAEGNEISYHQLLASNFILNHTNQANQFEIYPFATTFTNNISRQNQLKKVFIPDIHPATTMATQSTSNLQGEMSMTASDFTLCYSTSEYTNTFDAVISVFFIDTAPNIIRYIDTVKNCLVSNGIWINIGPLLWHFDDRDDSQRQNKNSDNKSKIEIQEDQDKGIGEPGSVELTNEEVLLLLEKFGFKIIFHEILSPTLPSSPQGVTTGIGSGYIQDSNSMLQNLYKSSHWIVKKIV